MKVRVVARPPAEWSADLTALLLPKLDPEKWQLPSRLRALDKACGGALSRALGTGDFRGGRGETLVVYAENGSAARRLLFVGLGEEKDLDATVLRAAAAGAVSHKSARRGGKVLIGLPAHRRVRTPAAVQALSEGSVLGGYRFDRYKQRDEDAAKDVTEVTIAIERSADLRGARAAASAGQHLAESQNLARDLSNEPPNALPPAALAREAKRMAREVGLRCRVLEPAELEKRKMGAILAVGGGSVNTPRLIVLEHNAPTRKRGSASGRKRPTVCLVGKGVCFDSGGLSLKPTASMVSMKHDMSGGATVIGALRAAALLKLPIHLVGVVGAVENMPSGTAYRPDDVVTTMSGKTVEIGNTDAEGRLVLADALHYAKTEFEPEAMIDFATLTGAAVVALGTWAAGVLGNHERLAEAIVAAGETTGERYWRLPLWDVHREAMRGRIADVKQVGGRDGGTITASAFLWHFAGDDVPWAHLDIAPTANTERSTPLQPPGATGFGVRSTLELLRGWRDLKLG